MSSTEIILPHQIKGYTLLRQIGYGGFGVVYLAEQAILDRHVAIKAINLVYANMPEFVRSFEVEAQLIARLDHLHIVPLYDYWRDPSGTYLVMRWLKGGSLQHKLLDKHPITLDQAIKWMEQIAAALSYAHYHQIIHQDLKPENILLDEAQNAYLSDFGIAKDISQVSPAETSKHVFGTPYYMAPEQIYGSAISPQTDVYGLGTVLYTLLARPTPEQIDINLEEALDRKSYELQPITLTRPDLPSKIDEILWRATSHNPQNRYSDITEFAQDLARLTPKSTPQQFQFAGNPLIESIEDEGGATRSLSRQFQVEVYPNPYKGLRPFEEADARDYFGRKDQIYSLVSHLEKSNFIAVIGASGSGKSSLIQAGLIPELRHKHPTWYFASFTPTTSPLQALEQALLSVALHNTGYSLAEKLMQSDSALHEMLEILLPKIDLFLLIDQFEELFIQTTDETIRQKFIANLVFALKQANCRLHLVLTLRADFYDRPLQYADLAALVRDNTEIILPLGNTQIAEVIRHPLGKTATLIEDHLVSGLIEEVQNQPAILPLLQFTLRELYDQQQNYMITFAQYLEMGRLTGALSRRATELYQRLNADEVKLLQQIFLRLVNYQTDSTPTRRRVFRSELLGLSSDRQAVEKLLNLFGGSRLLTFDYDMESRAPMVEVAHEALIQHWDLLRKWLDENVSLIRLQKRLAEATAEWENNQRDAGFLATGSRLAQLEILQESQNIQLTQPEQDFLKESLALRQQSRRRIQMGIVLLVILTLMSMGLAGWAFQQQRVAEFAQATSEAERDRANQQAAIARSRELASFASNALPELDLSLLLSLEAVKRFNTYEAQASLLSGLNTNAYLQSYFQGSTTSLRSLDVTPNIIIGAGDDGNLYVWDRSTHQLLNTYAATQQARIWEIRVNAQGTLLATAGENGHIDLWTIDETRLKFQRSLQGHSDQVWSLDFHPDGEWLASSGTKGEVLLWNLQEGADFISLVAHQEDVFHVTFSPDGNLLATGGVDQNLILWNVEDLESDSPVDGTILRGHENWILSFAFSPDGSLLASTGAEGSIFLWDVANSTALGKLETNHSNWIRDIKFSPTGAFLSTASADNSIRIWDVQNGQLAIPPLLGHSDAIWEAEFLDDTTLLSASLDHHLIEWDLQPVHRLARRIAQSDAPFWSLALANPSCQVAISGGSLNQDGSNAIEIWQSPCDAQPFAPQKIESYQDHTGAVLALAFDSNGNILLSGGVDRQIIVRSLEEGAIQEQLTDPMGSITALAIHPQKPIFASGDDRGNLFIWSMDDWQIIHQYAVMGTVSQIIFSSNGRWLAASDQSSNVLFWDVEHLDREPIPLNGHSDYVEALAFSPDSALLASGSRDSTMILWEPETQQMVGQPLVGHQNWVTSLAFSPNGNWLVSGSRDTNILLWNLDFKVPLPPLSQHTDWVTDVQFDATGQYILSLGRDGQFLTWNFSPTDWNQITCDLVKRSLTMMEWDIYFPNEDYDKQCIFGE